VCGLLGRISGLQTLVSSLHLTVELDSVVTALFDCGLLVRVFGLLNTVVVEILVDLLNHYLVFKFVFEVMVVLQIFVIVKFQSVPCSIGVVEQFAAPNEFEFLFFIFRPHFHAARYLDFIGLNVVQSEVLSQDLLVFRQIYFFVMGIQHDIVCESHSDLYVVVYVNLGLAFRHSLDQTVVVFVSLNVSAETDVQSHGDAYVQILRILFVEVYVGQQLRVTNSKYLAAFL